MAVFEQPAEVPITEYVVVAAGLAVTNEPTAEFKPVDGNQVYEEAPLTARSTEPPTHICDGLYAILLWAL